MTYPKNRRKPHVWTSEEEALLIRDYPSLGDREFHRLRMPYVSIAQVRGKVASLKLKLSPERVRKNREAAKKKSRVSQRADLKALVQEDLSKEEKALRNQFLYSPTFGDLLGSRIYKPN